MSCKQVYVVSIHCFRLNWNLRINQSGLESEAIRRNKKQYCNIQSIIDKTIVLEFSVEANKGSDYLTSNALFDIPGKDSFA